MNLVYKTVSGSLVIQAIYLPMAYDELLANRVREALMDQPQVEEKKMFQGLCFMVNDKLCIGVRNKELMCRIGEAEMNLSLENEYCRQIIHNGKPMKDYIFVDTERHFLAKELEHWISLSLNFNSTAKASKKKK